MKVVPPNEPPPPLPGLVKPGAVPPSTQPDFSTLPPSIAASLARLAGGLPPPAANGEGVSPETQKGDVKVASKAGAGSGGA